MNEKLYIVDYPKKSDYAEAALIQVQYDYDRFDVCPQCGRRVSGAYWKKPREVVLTKHKVPDFLYAYCDNVPFLVSDNFLAKYFAAGLKGIQCAEEIESVRYQRTSKNDSAVPRYFHIELLRSQITVDHQKSIITYGKADGDLFCPLCNQVPGTYDFIRSLSFKGAFEGYDIFQTYKLGNTVLLSQRFVDFCNENKFTNLHFAPAEKHGRWAASYFLDGIETEEED